MSADQPSLLPIGGSHAIEVMAFGIEWDAEFDATGIAVCERAYDASDTLRSLLPSRHTMRGLKFEFKDAAAGTDSFQFSQAEVGGVEYRSPARADGMSEWAVTIQQNTLVATCRAYTRWDQISRQGVQLLAPFADALIESGRSIGVIGLQYHDAWISQRKVGSTAYAALFRRDTRRIPPEILQSSDLWHLHQGWIAEGHGKRRNLHSVNIDVVDEGAGRRVNLIGMHKAFAAEIDGITPAPFVRDDFLPYLDALHIVNRELLIDLIADDMLERIRLEKSK